MNSRRAADGPAPAAFMLTALLILLLPTTTSSASPTPDNTCDATNPSTAASCGGRLGLSWLLHPMAVDRFLDDHWERSPVLVSRNQSSNGDGDAEPDYYDGIYSMENISAIMDSFADQRLHDDFVIVKEGFVTPKSFNRLNESYPAYLAGYTTSLFIINRLWHPVGKVCADLGADLGFPFRVNMYLTPRSSKGFLPHTDTHDFFIMQMAGAKRWRVYGSPVHLPTRAMELGKLPGREINRTTLDAAPLVDATLYPGDVLYVPRGFVHEAETLEESSGAMHLTVRVLNSFFFTWGHFFQYALIGSGAGGAAAGRANKNKKGKAARADAATKDWEKKRKQQQRRRMKKEKKKKKQAAADKKGGSSSGGGDDNKDGVEESGEHLPSMVPLADLRNWDGAFRQSLPVKFLEEEEDVATAARRIRGLVCDGDRRESGGGGNEDKKCVPRREWVAAFARALWNAEAETPAAAGGATTKAAAADGDQEGHRRLQWAGVASSSSDNDAGAEIRFGKAVAELAPPSIRELSAMTTKELAAKEGGVARALAKWLKRHINIEAAIEKLGALRQKIHKEHATLLSNVRQIYPQGLKPTLALDSWVVVRAGLCIIAAGAEGGSEGDGDGQGEFLLSNDCKGRKKKRKKKKKKKKESLGYPPPAPNTLAEPLRFRGALRRVVQEVLDRGEGGGPFRPQELRHAGDDFERIALLRTLRAAGAVDSVRIVGK